MRWTTATLALLGFLALCTADDKTDPKVQPVRELIVKDLKIGKVKAKLDEPAKVTNAEELAKLVADKDEAAKIAKEIDFAKEYLIVFAWEGSGQDRLDHAIKAEKDELSVSFTYTAGRTRDLRQHLHMYVVKKDVVFKAPPKI